MGMRIDEVVQKYVALRDERDRVKDETKAKVAEIEEKMAKIEVALLQTLDGAGLQSVNTAAGTAYIDRKQFASIGDKNSFLEHIRANDDWSLMDIRANKPSIRQFIEAHEGALPPGINWREERTITVRR